MSAKVKISVTVSAEVLALVDRAARSAGATRSGVIDGWLRTSASRAAERSIDDATAAYYAALRGDAADEADGIARAASRAAGEVTYDARPRRRGRGRPR